MLIKIFVVSFGNKIYNIISKKDVIMFLKLAKILIRYIKE